MVDPYHLLEFCAHIGISQETVRQAESLPGFQLSTDVRAGDLKRLSEDRILALLEQFGTALSLSIGIPDVTPLIEIEAGDVSTDDIQDRLEEIQKRSAEFELRLTIILDKRELLSQLHLSDAQYVSYLYLFMNNLVSFMDSSLPDLDNNLFDTDDRPTIMVVCDTDICFRGPLLTITGLNSIQQALDALPSTNRRQLARIRACRSQALENLNWIGFQLKCLTPFHFIGEQISGAPSELDSIITRHLLHLCILFTANRSTFDDRAFTSTYASPDSSVKLKLVSKSNLPDTALLARVALWPYAGERQDRLVIFQTVVTHFLGDDNPEENYRLFAGQLSQILREARWNHRIYIGGQIDGHFQQVQTVTDYVSEMTGEVSKSLDSVTKGFVDTSLATICVIVLTLLASLVEGETNNTIFRVGMWVYAAYLVLFQGAYRMGSIWHSYYLLNEQTETWLSATAQRLGKKRISEISAPLTARKKQFKLWFWATAILYLALAFSIVLLSIYPPSLLQQTGAATATPTPPP